MAIETICTSCGKKLRVDDQYAGRQARCPMCSQVYTVPSPSEPSSGIASTSDTPWIAPEDTTPPAQPLQESTPTAAANPFAIPDPRRGTESFTTPVDGSYWVRIPDGNVFGPSDLATLKRWIQEGRLNATCQVRLEESGPWQPATQVFVELQTNYYASGPVVQYAGLPQSQTQTRANDNGTTALVLAIVSWLTLPTSCCCALSPMLGMILSIIGMILSSTDLKAVREGRIPDHSKSTLQVAFYLCLAYLILTALSIVGYVIFIVIAIATGNR